MADSCILGPKLHCHVVCRNWTREVVLYRDGQELYCRTSGPWEIDGAACEGRGPITRNSRIQGDGFSFSLEAITLIPPVNTLPVLGSDTGLRPIATVRLAAVRLQ